MFNVSEEKQQTMAGKGHFIRLKPVIFAWFLLIVKTYNREGRLKCLQQAPSFSGNIWTINCWHKLQWSAMFAAADNTW